MGASRALLDWLGPCLRMVHTGALNSLLQLAVFERAVFCIHGHTCIAHKPYQTELELLLWYHLRKASRLLPLQSHL